MANEPRKLNFDIGAKMIDGTPFTVDKSGADVKAILCANCARSIPTKPQQDARWSDLIVNALSVRMADDKLDGLQQQARFHLLRKVQRGGEKLYKHDELTQIRDAVCKAFFNIQLTGQLVDLIDGTIEDE
jgi:hypothetical protein